MMSSWTGLLSLCALSGGEIPLVNIFRKEMDAMPTFHGVRSLVDALRVKSAVVRVVLLDLWFEVLNIRIGSWAQNFLAGRRLTSTTFIKITLTLVFGRPLAYQTTDNNTISEPDRRTNLFT